MKAYANHFIVDDEHTNLLVTFDSSVAFILQQSQRSEDDVSVKSNILGHWRRFWNWIFMVTCFHLLFYFIVVGWKKGLT
jgi:hypothetical protein